jgi:AraC-like DNA-binding protein
VEQVVEQVLEAVQQRLGEQLTLDDLAAIAMFSKFHFARMFRSVTGTSPRRFLYALRLQEAKRLLVNTSLSVADISHRVGYSSVGTFTSRFTASVGVPPAVYRKLRGRVSSVLRGEPPDPTVPGVIRGRLEVPDQLAGAAGPESPVLVGLFRKPVPEGRPIRCELLSRPGDWTFRHVPAGWWYVLAISARVPPGSAQEPEASMISVRGPVRVSPESPTAYVTVRLRPVRPVDPPIVTPLAWAATATRAADSRRYPARGSDPRPGACPAAGLAPLPG